MEEKNGYHQWYCQQYLGATGRVTLEHHKWSEWCNYSAGGVWGVHCEHPQWGPGMKPLEALTYLCFPDPEMANYETLKQVVCSWKIQCTPSKTSAEAAILSVDNIIVYFTESKSHIWRFCITQVGLEKHVRSVFLSFLIQSIGH